jgi:hypothetical protein
VVDVLRVAEAVAGYAAGQVGNGLGPGGARCAALEAAEELAEVAVRLRRLARLERPGGRERRDLAVELEGRGWTRQEIAGWLGVSDQSVRRYLRAGPAGGPGNATAGDS